MVLEISDDATSKLQSLRFDRARLDRIGDWMARYVAQGKYAGSCVRVDQSLVITSHSDLLPLRIVEDENL